LGWILLAHAPQAPTLVEPSALNVEILTPRTPDTPDKAAKPKRAPAEARPIKAQLKAPLGSEEPAALPTTRPAVAPPPGVVAPPGIVAPPGFTARGTLTGGGEALRQAARKSACGEADIVRLTKAEREACAEALGARHKNEPALYAAIDPEKKAAFDGDCKRDDEWCLYRTGKGPYPGLFAIGKKRKIPGWD
jgi:hypothetical protein